MRLLGQVPLEALSGTRIPFKAEQRSMSQVELLQTSIRIQLILMTEQHKQRLAVAVGVVRH